MYINTNFYFNKLPAKAAKLYNKPHKGILIIQLQVHYPLFDISQMYQLTKFVVNEYHHIHI